MAFFSLSLFLSSLRLIANSPRKGCHRAPKSCMGSQPKLCTVSVHPDILLINSHHLLSSNSPTQHIITCQACPVNIISSSTFSLLRTGETSSSAKLKMKDKALYSLKSVLHRMLSVGNLELIASYILGTREMALIGLIGIYTDFR